MTNQMVERGPDAEGYYVERRIGLGHRRLTVIDLEAGEQPVYNEDRTKLVVFNGEIFNYREIRKELEAAGHRFTTNTDTEVIVHAYEQYGRQCVQHFRGMFAFALFDTHSGELFLARDRLGVKPLYYCMDGDRLLFASEIKPLLTALNRPVVADPAAVEYFLSVGYVPGELTIFQGIRKLLPGHYMHCSGSRRQVEKYWEVPDQPALQIAEPEALERLGTLLRESVRLRMISDVPLGAFLSGGVDSSVIVAQMCELSSSRVKTFSIGYDDGPESNELPHARRVADLLGTDHVEYYLSHGDFFENLDAFVNRTEEPIVESAGIALYHLARRARQDVTVVLSGEGGDEILAGYPAYRNMRMIEVLASVARHTGLSGVPLWLARRAPLEKMQKYLEWLSQRFAERYQSIPSDVTPLIRARMFEPAFLERTGTSVADYFQALLAHLQHASPLKRLSYTDIKSWLPDDLLVKADKMTMAASVELRVPFLDHKLLEFCLQLPDDLRLRGVTGKYLLKRLAQRWLPDDILYRKKQGFPVPIARWFRGKLRGAIEEILLDPRTLQRGYLRPDYVRQVLELHGSERGDYSRRILSMLILELWHRRFVDAGAASGATAPHNDTTAMMAG
jgi:asparagine synthase (glutamine-hydrolysing)